MFYPPICQLPVSRPARLRAEYQLVFGGDFRRWRRQAGGWVLDPSAELSTAAGALEGSVESPIDEFEHKLFDHEWFDSLAAKWPAAPQTKRLPDGRWFVASLTEDAEGELEIVAGCIKVDENELVARAATLAAQQVEAESHRELADRYAPLLSASYEELTFLRRLSRHIEDCVADRSLEEVASTILPRLYEILGVEGLCLIVAKTSPSGQIRAEKLANVVGAVPLAASDGACWRRFVEQLGDANRRVVVKNYQGILGKNEKAPMPEAKSIVLAPIAKEGTLFGWLLGINKRAEAYAGFTADDLLGRDEIGSMEGSLLEAAALMLGAHASNHRLFRELEQLIVDVIHTLVGVIEAKDAYTCGHSDRVALIARRLGQECGLPPAECQDIYLSGLLHDIGKIGVADDVLTKPGKLTAEEFDQIKAHPATGARLLQGLRPLEKLIPGVLHHHEAIDGSGYPCGLEGEQIPLMARVLAVADAFDALTSDRPYRSGMPLDKAEEILRDGAGTQWDATIVAAYFAARDDILATNANWHSHLGELLKRQPMASKDDFQMQGFAR
jgi:HD-GYP domain-containing protein (c-di-GMP phosphodiesterase class II)